MLKLSNYINYNKAFFYLPKRIRDIFSYRFLWNTDFPEEIHIENTNACNARCLMCPREKMTRKIGMMNFSLFQKIIDECATYKQLKVIHLHGYGECLLEKYFFSKVSYAKEKGIETTYLVTNGSLMTKEVANRLIYSGLDKIKISFYGATAQTYEKVHVNLKFEEVKNNILNLFEMRDKLQRKNPSVLLQFLPLKENKQEKDLFWKYWERIIDKKKGDSIVEYRLHNYGLGKKYNIIETDGINIRRGCSLPFTTMQILWNGDVVPCCFDFNGDFILANIKEQTLKEIWNGVAFSKLREAHRTLDFQMVSLCEQCDQIIKLKI